MPVYRESGQTILYDVVKVQTCSGQPLETQAAGTAADAFGRQRIAQPLTLFDSSHTRS